MIDRIANSPKPSAMSTRTRGQQRDRHEDADVERDVGQQQVGAPMAAEVQHVGQQEDRRDVDDQVDRVVGVCGEHLGALSMSSTSCRPSCAGTRFCPVSSAPSDCEKDALAGAALQSAEGPHHGLRSRRVHGLSSHERAAVHYGQPDLSTATTMERSPTPSEATPRTRRGVVLPPAKGRLSAHSAVGISRPRDRGSTPRIGGETPSIARTVCRSLFGTATSADDAISPARPGRTS